MSKFMIFTRVGLISGAIFALWHYPLILREFGWAALAVTVPLARICWHYRGSLPGAS
ncbi:hypothetical protein Mpal_0664 [Methanosphaerula palustris E1-9c]|uniref:Uncharacterized protein n=2 Tax=Methanosphaerula palustris TaxID=475088 RepID=B8GFI5_METPE|nr:hypothetical protein Mpal_0664 [Methanosphaerula palustris E1-9c]